MRRKNLEGNRALQADVACSIHLSHPACGRAVGIQNTLGPYAVTANGKKFLINSGDVKEENQPPTMVQNWSAQLKK